MSDFSALNAAISGLHAHRQRIDVISGNIANIDTPGYHRQVTHLSPIDTSRPGLFSGPGGQHGGVDATVRRRWDQLLESNVNQRNSQASSLGAQAAGMNRIESEVGSLTGGLASKLQELWDGFDDLANNPNDAAVRNVVLGSAQAVASVLRADGAAIDSSHRDTVDKAEALVSEVNQLTRAIAELDESIVAGVAAGNPPNGLLDQRDRLVNELSGLVDIDVAHQMDGKVRISLNGHNLVADATAQTIRLDATADATLGALGYDRISIVTESGRALAPAGGLLHGAVQLANELIPEQRMSLDDVAASILTEVNALHEAGSGLDGSTGFSLFDPTGTTAATFAVSADLLGHPERLAASDGSAVLDNSVALAIAGLGTKPGGPSAMHADFVANLGNRVKTLSDRSENASIAAERAKSVNQAQVGVSLDEELADLVTAQRAYEASSRMISAIDEMLDVLINRTGLVGR